jgi:membrane protein DedA with SNARE-associated domain
LLLSAAAVLTLGSFIGVGLAPTLLTYHPLLLIALSPLDRHLVVAATVTPMLPFVIVATARRMLMCTLGFGFGRAYGDEGLLFLQARYPSMRRAIATVERLLRRAAPIVLLLAPWPIICAMAGVTRVRLRLFLAMATLGQLMWTSLTYRLGEALRARIAPMLVFLREHVISTTLACLLAVAVYAWLRRGQRSEALPELGAEVPNPIQTAGLTPPPSSSDG